MPTDHEREERAIWKLEQGGYAVTRAGTSYVVTAPDSATTSADDLTALVAFADAVYGRVWSRRKITPSA